MTATTDLQARISRQYTTVINNMRWGATSDQAKEEAVALFRLARMASPIPGNPTPWTNPLQRQWADTMLAIGASNFAQLVDYTNILIATRNRPDCVGDTIATFDWMIDVAKAAQAATGQPCLCPDCSN